MTRKQKMHDFKGFTEFLDEPSNLVIKSYFPFQLSTGFQSKYGTLVYCILHRKNALLIQCGVEIVWDNADSVYGWHPPADFFAGVDDNLGLRSLNTLPNLRLLLVLMYYKYSHQ